MGLERGPLSLVNTIEEQLGRNSSGSGLENREYGRGNPLCWPLDTPYRQKLALTSTTSGGRSVGIDRLQAKATEFVSLFVLRTSISCYYYYFSTHKSCILSRLLVTIDGVWIGEWIYWPLTGRNYK
jgi:hypothetical protein